MSPAAAGLTRFPVVSDGVRCRSICLQTKPSPAASGPYTGAEEDAQIATPLSLSALSLDLIIALAQRRGGIGSSELTRIVVGPPTTVQNSLRLLVAHGLVTRSGTRFALARAHPAAGEAVALGLRLAPPGAAMRLVVRASDSVEVAIADEMGLIVGLRADADPESLALLDSSLATIGRDRSDVPQVLRFETRELARILHSALGLRSRVAVADIVKGTVRPAGPSDGDGYPERPGSFARTR